MRSFCHTCHDTQHPPEDRSITEETQLHRRITESEKLQQERLKDTEKEGGGERRERGDGGGVTAPYELTDNMVLANSLALGTGSRWSCVGLFVITARSRLHLHILCHCHSEVQRSSRTTP